MSWSSPCALICALTTASPLMPSGRIWCPQQRGASAEMPCGTQPGWVSWVAPVGDGSAVLRTLMCHPALLCFFPHRPPPSVQRTNVLRWAHSLFLQGSTAVKPGTFCPCGPWDTWLHPPIFAAVFSFPIIPFPRLNMSSTHKLSHEPS